MKWVGKREGEGLGRVGQGKDPSVCLSMKFPCGRGPRVQSQGPVLPAGRGQTEEGFLSAWVWTTGQAGGSTEPDCLFQDSDLKQYLDHCGNLMSMHNVKVRDLIMAATCHRGQRGVLFFPPAAEVAQRFKRRKGGKATRLV